ncbi:putative reverse transcriptase zinc-binding domain-containing protein [Helianthus annuus]|nr:putative reverse transcriptase zinc-binding domain-containing protein [Helianthus annuus]KAJ0497612.1 putative reverse transcriptase zinc-binding domain-containing protein [Helianthus annuus]KAJ0663617.1 putative reverse transcriptase zinc-binding domain-containing protein [Helianthus annuus]KAJ0671115.1 putative reverse transcriptase zinc-binding domain-containing protein [Helianthus annuus]KAJ0858112.1 putative reverse transcriptase zinc-binding domain-containing protein [Helianthus annuus
MNRVNNWKPVYDIFESRLALWKSSLLSIGGRITLIRSVLVSLPNYFFSLYKAPVKVINDLERMIRKFLWGGSGDISKTHWVAWDILSLPIKSGGLGISKLNHVNRALLCKWGWRYKKERDNLWVKVVDAIHFGGSGWAFLPVKKTFGGVWSNVVSVISKPLVDNRTLRGFFRGMVGRGDSIFFWLDPWLRDVPLKEVFPNLFSLEVVKTCSIRDRLCGNWLWRHNPDLDDERSELDALMSAISSISLSDRPDDWSWLPNRPGIFSVNSVKKTLDSLVDCRNLFVLDWCKWVPLKCNVFVWRTEMNRIPTLDVLRSRGIGVGDGICPLCKSEVESVDHLFTSCIMATILWQKISRWCHISPIFAFSFKDLLVIHRDKYIDHRVKPVVHGIIISACWCLWLARNKAVFSGVEAKAESIFSEVRSLGFLWYKNRSRNWSISWSDWCKFVIM